MYYFFFCKKIFSNLSPHKLIGDTFDRIYTVLKNDTGSATSCIKWKLGENIEKNL